MSYTLKVDWPEVEGILLQVLKEDLDGLRRDWENVYKTQKGFVFSHNAAEDLEQISELISAYKKVIRYHGGNTN